MALSVWRKNSGKEKTPMDKQTAKLGARILENLPEMDSEVMQGWINDPKGLQDALRQALCRFKTFMTIKIGTLKDVASIRKAIADAGGRISGCANDLLGKDAFTVATEVTEVELVVASVPELGFKDGNKYFAICQRAKQLGLDLCPAEVGPQLRLQYTDQPKGERFRIAMEPITDSDGCLHIFYVGRDGSELYLDGYHGHPDLWFTNDRFVFIRRKVTRAPFGLKNLGLS